jgi:hypothetical protein
MTADAHRTQAQASGTPPQWETFSTGACPEDLASGRRQDEKG